MADVTRRGFLQASAAAVVVGATRLQAETEAQIPLPVAGIVTEYRNNSHADVILGKILAGYDQMGGPGPGLKLVSLFTDQVPTNDMSRGLAEKYGFRIATSIDDALTLGTDRLQVAGVLNIGEHGDYPLTSDTKQRQYPRRRLFDGVVACFERVGKVVPVFNDKHLAYRWSDAKHMYDTAVERKIPFMAGSSVPVAWRNPPLALPMGCEIEEAFALSYGGLESYGFHALEALQCMVERRAGGERGVAAVRTWQGAEIPKSLERKEWSWDLMTAAFKAASETPPADLKNLHEQAAFYQIEYRDGLKATVAMANGIARKNSFAARLKGQAEPAATCFELQNGKPYGHFGYLVRAIEHMVRMGKPAYPVERTLLTTGMLDAVMHSLAEGGRRRETPELDVRYQPADWPFPRRES